MDVELPYEICSRSDTVELWLQTRLPFEPKGTMLEARNRLRNALRSLAPCPEKLFVAEYACESSARFDVENVLFYNVGPSEFSKLSHQGLRGYRSYRRPRTSPSGQQFEHYQRYYFENISTKVETGALLTLELPKASSSIKPHQIWWAASGGALTGAVLIQQKFSLVVELPQGWGSLANAMKPLLDGVISALHSAESIDPVAIERLAAATGWPQAEILHRLEKPAAPLLGSRQVLRPYREFIKWDPADDLCDEFTIIPGSKDGLCRVWIRSETESVS